MASALQRAWQSLKDIGGTWGIAVAIIAAGVVGAYQFVGPPPPDRIVMATGEEGGAYRLYGERYAALLAREGIHLELLPSAGSVENLDLIASGRADVGFVQSGLGGPAAPESVLALGSLYPEPLWLFLRDSLTIADAGDLKGRRISIGPEGSGTRAAALTVLQANGVDAGNAELLPLNSADIAAALANDEIDAALLIASTESAVIRELIAMPGLGLFDFDRTVAYTRVFRFLSPVLLPQGVLDFDADQPDRDIHTVAPSAMLVANRDLHPALIDLLLVAADTIHGGDSLLADAGEFPSPRYIDLPLSEEAARHFEFGPPFLLRYLPFWAATLVDRLWVLLLPLIGLAIPVFKFVPPAYRWRIRRRLLSIYDDLNALDPAQSPVGDDAERSRRLAALESIDQEVAGLAVPRGYMDDVYKLRRDVDLLRRRLSAGAGNKDLPGR